MVIPRRSAGNRRAYRGKVSIGRALFRDFGLIDGRGVDLLLSAHHQGAGKLLSDPQTDAFPGDGGL